MIKKLVTIISVMAISLFSILPFTACTNGESVIKINEVTHSVFYAPLYLADSLGYFKDEKVKIELTNGGGADASMAALLSGSADVAFCGPEAGIYVILGGSSDAPKVFGQLTKRDGSFLVGRVQDDDFSWSKLAGKEILAGRRGGVPAMTFEYTLKTLGVSATLNYDVAFNMMTSAFESGVADYCTMFEPTASDYQSAGKGYIVASVGQESGEIPYTCFMAKQSYIDKNGDKIDALLRAVTKAIKYIDEHDANDVAQKIAYFFDGTSVSSLATSIQNYKTIDAWVKNMAMQESAFNRLQDVMQNAGELERRINFADLVLTDRANQIYNEIY